MNYLFLSFFLSFLLAFGIAGSFSAEDATSSAPLSFAKEQTSIDLNKVEWAPGADRL